MIRPFRLSDVPAAASMIRDTFDSKLWPFMTYTQSGAAEYLAVALEFPGSTPANESSVMVEEGSDSISGYADFRLLGDGLAHLSYICVAPEARGKGVASRLIADFLGRHSEVNRMQLDVFDSNNSARSLYRKLGFVDIGESVWITRVLPSPRGKLPIDNLAFALAAHKAYGFCELDVRVGDVVKKFGRLGDSVIRVFSISDFADDSSLAALRAMLLTPSAAFNIVPESELATVVVDYNIVNRSIRMMLGIDRKPVSSGGKMSNIIPKTAVQVDRFRRFATFYESAREGMKDFLSHLPGIERGGVLLPGYVGWSAREGSGVFDPIRETQIPYAFYDLNRDLSVNLDSLQKQLDAVDVAVLVVIHYFGRTEPQLETIRCLAEERGILLVEDLAHGFFTAQGSGPAGQAGDMCLFSLHKQFPFVDGGMVTYSDRKLFSGQVETRPDLASQVLSYDWRRIAAARRRNFEVLTELLANLPERDREFELLWPQLENYDVPQSLPVYILGGNRDHVYSQMNAEGFGMVSLYHTLIPEIGDEFPMLNRISRHIINFPVHQDVDVSRLAEMVESFSRCLE